MRKITSTNYQNEAGLVAGCPLAAAMKLLGGRWKIMILWYVHHGIDRYGRLRATIPTISEKMLYQQLRELERDGLLSRTVDGRAVHYQPTATARSLVPAMDALEQWGRMHRLTERAHQPSQPASRR